jgi:hypothetical protein
MRLPLAWLVCSALFVIQGCASTNIEGRAHAEASSKIELLAVVFDDTTVLKPPADPKKIVSPSLVRDAADMERWLINGIRERFPAIFAAHGIQLQFYNRSSGAARFGEEAAGRRHVLHLVPNRASWSRGVRTTSLTVKARLDELQPTRTLWTGWINLHRHDFASLDKKLLDESATKIIEELKTAGLIGPAARTVSGMEPKPMSEPKALVPFAAAPQSKARSIGVNDVDIVPHLNERGRQGYREWLTKRFPRAFVIAENGHWNSTWGTNPKNEDDPKDPVARALAHCQKRGMQNCRVYAVDDRVVWSGQ